jgi:hypothetical protein
MRNVDEFEPYILTHTAGREVLTQSRKAAKAQRMLCAFAALREIPAPSWELQFTSEAK